MAFDLLIKNGRVVDGSGEPAFQADVAVKDGKIVGVGKYNGAAAERTIDAAGRGVAPGFIDHHTHFDPQAVWDPYCGSWVHNGHTTVIVGQCGQVIAPVRPGDGGQADLRLDGVDVGQLTRTSEIPVRLRGRLSGGAGLTYRGRSARQLSIR
jgi:N-acyl-D-aspartate/D-glutamate deacylase